MDLQRSRRRSITVRPVENLWDQISLMSMVKGPQLKLELVSQLDKRLKIRDSIAVNIQENLISQQRSKALPLELLREIALHVLGAVSISRGTPVILRRDHCRGLLERMPEVPCLAQPRKWTEVTAQFAVHTRSVLSASELHIPPGLVGVCKHVFGADLGAAAPRTYGVLDNVGFATHVVPAAREDEGGRDTARLDHLDLMVLRLETIDAPHEGGDILA